MNIYVNFINRLLKLIWKIDEVNKIFLRKKKINIFFLKWDNMRNNFLDI